MPTQETIVAYLATTGQQLTDFHGLPIGHFQITNSWRNPRHYYTSTHTYAVEAWVNGTHYHGRTQGRGMSVVLRPYKHQS